MRLFSPNSCGVWNAGELWKVWPHNVWPARWLLGSVESGDQTCVTSINLGQKSPEQINKLQICVAWNASQCDVTWSWITITDQYSPHWQWKTRRVKIGVTPGWPEHTCLCCLLRQMVTCEPSLWSQPARAWEAEVGYRGNAVCCRATKHFIVIFLSRYWISRILI